MKQKLTNMYLDFMYWWFGVPFEIKYLMFVVIWMSFIMIVYFLESPAI